MLSKSTLNTHLFCTFLLALSVCQTIYGQVVIGTPTLGFTQACGSNTFNTFSTTFIFSPQSVVQSSNQFIVEFSDSEGDFTNPTSVFTSVAGAITTSPATLSFSLPETTAGENYRLRIKSTAPAATSSRSVAFSAYFKLQDSPFSINNLQSTGAFCTGGDYLLTIDNPGGATNDSPLAYPSLTYNWFRVTSPTTSVFVSAGQTLSVNTEGTYFVETNYGSCSSDSFSNRVTITESTSTVADATISSSLGNPFCPVSGQTTLTTISGNSYQWFKDNVLIEGATNQTYQTGESGVFSVQVNIGVCQATGSIDLISEIFEAEINVLESNTLNNGDVLEIEITSNASDPEFEWFLNNELLTDATEATFEASAFGNYTVIITETEGCMANKAFDFEIIEAENPFPNVDNIPNLVSPNGDGINDVWILPTDYVSGTDTAITILDNRGSIVFQTNNYQNNWPENNLGLATINNVFYYIITPSTGKTKKGSITVIK